VWPATPPVPCAFFALLLSLSAGCSYSAPPLANNYPPAQKIYDTALESARLSKKPVFIVFTQNEIWCQRLKSYEADDEVARMLDQHFVRIHLPIDLDQDAERMYYERGGDRGVPAYTIVDPEGEPLADSGDTRQNNIGFPNTDDEVERYLKMLKTACPEITDGEQLLLRTKLEARRVTDAPSN